MKVTGKRYEILKSRMIASVIFLGVTSSHPFSSGVEEAQEEVEKAKKNHLFFLGDLQKAKQIREAALRLLQVP